MAEQRDVISDMDADLVKSMVLSLLQKDEDGSKPKKK